MGQDALRPLGPDVAEALQQAGDARHVVGARLQPVGEELRHLLEGGGAARAPLEKGLCLRAAQQQAGALGAVKALVPRHGDEGRSQLSHPHRQAAGGLGGVQHKGDPPRPAQGGDLPNRQHEAEYIGHVGAEHRLHVPVQLPLKGRQLGLPVKKGCLRHPHLRPQGAEGAGDGVVLIAGDHHRVPRLQQGADGDIQAVGGVEGKHHLLRVLQMEELRRGPAAGEGRLRRSHGGGVAAPPRGGQMVHRPGHGPGHGGRLLQGGGCAVQIDHNSTSL